MKKMKARISLVAFGLTALLFACRPTSPDYISDYDRVVTNYNPDYNFTAVNTYFLPDSVVFATDNPGQSVVHKYDDQILSAVRRNLNALGWTEISASPGNKADVVVVVGAAAQDYTSCSSYCWYCYWGWVGFSGQWARYMKNDRLSIGANLSYFYFSDKQGRKTENLTETITYTGFVTNFTNIYGLMAVGQYDLKPRRESLVPFVRIGVGTNYQDQRKDVGIYEFKTDGFQFMANGEFGLRFNTGGQFNWVVAAAYHYMPAASEMINTSFAGIKLGIQGFNY